MSVRNDYTIGILGAGQLANMTLQAAQKLGVKVKIWATHPDEPAIAFCDEYKVGEMQVKEVANFFSDCDVLGLESEFVPVETLKEIEERSGRKFVPTLESYGLLDTKMKEKIFMESLEIPVIPYALFEGPKTSLDFPCMLKFSRGGYDGYGNKILRTSNDIPSTSQEFFFEPLLKIKKEYAMTVVCSSKEHCFYPLVQTIQKKSICVEVVSEENDEVTEILKSWITKVVNKLHYRGILAFEFIENESGKIYFNETAPRVHNSQHLSQDTCKTSQFENYVRSMLEFPLGEAKRLYPYCGMLNILGVEDWSSYLKVLDEVSSWSGCKLHMYGKKEARVGRKMGHVNYWAQSNNDFEILRTKLKEKLGVGL
ncbi:MAG: ATP-grasp domain-containing protein [Halobacteriovoraceae bacterium]|nr:ATP-grasp domain-containing protein [Halobacteriovoraceae bacterium]